MRGPSVHRERAGGLWIAHLVGDDGEETVVTGAGDALTAAAAHGTVVSEEVFAAGLGPPRETAWPVTRSSVAPGPAGARVVADDRRVTPVLLDGHVVGARAGRLVRIGGLEAAAPAEIFGLLGRALAAAGAAPADLVRTWFWNRDILAGYPAFNAARARAFAAWSLDAPPASTGIGTTPPAPAFAAEALVRARPLAVRPVASPLQGPAPAYGSLFSRAVEIDDGALRRLLVSGTASISPDGTTAHVGDLDAQVALTLGVVEALLAARGLGWGDVATGVAYARDPAAPALARLDDLPVLLVGATVCREDLLFELEVEAVRPR